MTDRNPAKRQKTAAEMLANSFPDNHIHLPKPKKNKPVVKTFDILIKEEDYAT
jgi:hypothetical protein